MKKRIIICGYPKSGNTWLTRLVAEVLNCPVTGFWCEPLNDEMAIEGEKRESEFECFKSHHTHAQLNRTFKTYGNGSEKIIYIYRDPRDIIVSASKYFSPRISPQNKIMYSIATYLNTRLFWEYYNLYYHNDEYLQRIITNGLIYGTNEGDWLQAPWREHVNDFLKVESIHSLKFEDLKSFPFAELRKICDFINNPISDQSLIRAIEIQSFEKKKQLFLQNGNKKQAEFLREGMSGSWEKKLLSNNKKIIIDKLGCFMQDLGYYQLY